MSLFSSIADIFKYSRYFQYLDQIAQIAHDATDADSTKDKAADVLEDLINLAAPLVSAANPALAAEIAALVGVLSTELDKLKDKPVPVPAPAPAPPPANVPQYDIPIDGTLPSDTVLHSMGYRTGDRKLSSIAPPAQYMIVQPQGVWNVSLWNDEGTIA